MALGLRKKITNFLFYALFSSYSFDIWYMALPYQDTDQVWVWFWSIDFSQSYGPWTWKKKYHELSVLSTFFSHIHLIFGTLLCHTKKQIKFEFGFDPLIFHEVMALALRKKSRIFCFMALFSSYSFDILYMALPYLDTDQVWVWFWSIDFSWSYGPWT